MREMPVYLQHQLEIMLRVWLITLVV
eukprot:gene23861-30137_t